MAAFGKFHPVASQQRYVGKETDRKWERGEDFSLLQFKPAQFDELGKMAIADPELIKKIVTAKIKAVARMANVDRNTIRRIVRGLPVRRAMIQRLSAAIKQSFST